MDISITLLPMQNLAILSGMIQETRVLPTKKYFLICIKQNKK